MASFNSIKAKSALIGALVADAATMPLHWIYGMDKVEDILKGSKTPEFFNPPSCPFYSPETHPGHYNIGQSSPYGEELICLLDYMAKNDGDFVSPESFADALLQWAETFGGRQNHSIKQFVERRKAGAKFPSCGADDNQANAFMKGILIGVRYCGLPELPEKVEQAVRVHQNDDLAVEFGLAAARSIERLIMGESLRDLIATPNVDLGGHALEYTKMAAEKASLSTVDFLNVVAGSVGKNPTMTTSCALPGAFALPLHFTLTSTNYEEAIRDNIRLGGDNCSRACLLGAYFAASGSPIPPEWLAKTSDLKSFAAMVDVLVEKRAKIKA